MADCGSCGFCCRMLMVPDIGKPQNMACEHVGLHGGCAVHHLKTTDPNLLACAQFQCVWLASQDHPNEKVRMDRTWRPDICHVMFGPQDREDENLLYIHVDPRHPTAWCEPQILEYIHKDILARGCRIEIIIGNQRIPLDGKDLEKQVA